MTRASPHSPIGKVPMRQRKTKRSRSDTPCSCSSKKRPVPASKYAFLRGGPSKLSMAPLTRGGRPPRLSRCLPLSGWRSRWGSTALTRHWAQGESRPPGSAQISQPGFRLSRYPDPMSSSAPEPQQRVAVRRSPRLGAFIAVFGIVGFGVTLVVTGLYEVDPSIGFATLFAYFSLYGITGSIAVGIVLWLILDFRSKRRVREITMERDSHPES